jgi:hypothetical protein
MSKFRFAVALLSLSLSSAMLPSAANADNVCQNPSFRIGQGSPFKVRPQAGLEAQPTALAAGTYLVRPGAQPGQGCGCDLAVGLIGQSAPRQGFLALLRGNDDGTFNGTPDALHNLGGLPVAIATGRFRPDAPVDGILVVTSSPTGAGQVAVFAPDATGAYPQAPSAVFPAGPNPVAITTGDFNGDGNLDAAVISKDDSSVTILFGTGAGGFAPTVSNIANLGGVPESVTSGKFSGSFAADDIAIGVLQNVNGSRQVGIVIIPGIAGGSGSLTPKPVIAIGQRNSFGSSIKSANLSGPSEGTAGRRWRDLAITFTDRAANGDAVGRVKVLLGRDSGGFGDVNTAQTLDLGSSLPRSIKVADLDDDDTVDLVVSTFGDPASQTNGTVRFFQGHAAPANPVGFQPKQGWNTIPESTGIRPRALVAGRFGNHNPGQPIANVGIAAINAPDLNSIVVFQGNGQGAFTQPQLVTTALGDDDRLFVSGDFHSPDGSSPLQDLAFVSKDNGQNVLRVLEANGSGGFALPDQTQPPPLAGNSPSLMAAGRFVSGTGTAVVLIDDTGAAGQQPLLKVFVSQGSGVLTPSAEIPLFGIGKPRAMVAGHFKNTDMLDLALVSDTTTSGSSQANGKLTLLFNDPQLGFTLESSQPLGFSPAAVATSNRLSSFGKADLVIRDANTSRFQFLINIGNGNFRPAQGTNQGFFAGPGNVKTLLVGNVAHSGSETLDDVITYDDTGKTLQIFVNNGRESFDLRTFNAGNDPHFFGVQPSYQLADFGGGMLGLAAPIARGGAVGLLLLQSDGNGGFTPATGEVPLQLPRGAGTSTSATAFIQSTAPIPASSDGNIQLKQTVVAQFRTSLHGNSKPDFALITRAVETSQNPGNCAGDNTTPPSSRSGPQTPVCRVPSQFNDCPPSQRPCFEGPCCFCRTGPAKGQCRTTCDLPPGPPIPFQATCKTTSTYTPAISVFGNTCGD